MYDDGSDNDAHDQEWDGTSFCECKPCGKQGTVADFRVKESPAGKLPLHFSELTERLSNALDSLDGEDYARVFNMICGGRKIRYVGDDVWEETGEDDSVY
jgi:hypothetical protein